MRHLLVFINNFAYFSIHIKVLLLYTLKFIEPENVPPKNISVRTAATANSNGTGQGYFFVIALNLVKLINASAKKITCCTIRNDIIVELARININKRKNKRYVK